MIYKSWEFRKAVRPLFAEAVTNSDCFLGNLCSYTAEDFGLNLKVVSFSITIDHECYSGYRSGHAVRIA